MAADSRELERFLDPTPDALREQWLSVLARKPVPRGTRQVHFIPSEVVLALCASLLIDHRPFGSSSAHKAGFPVQHLARLYHRPPTSILAKMANLDGTRSNGGKYELEVAARLQSNGELLRDIYRRILRSARSVGIDRDQLPDFLGLEGGDELWLAGQDQLQDYDIEVALQQRVDDFTAKRDDLAPEVTQRLLTSTARIGQHRFASGVLSNHGHRCVFCGLPGTIAGKRRPRLLTASHIKPWRSSSDKERLDVRNGLTACPTHDVAFDTGLITVDKNLRIHRAPDVKAALSGDAALRYSFAKPPLEDTLILPVTAQKPEIAYLAWHRNEIFTGG